MAGGNDNGARITFGCGFFGMLGIAFVVLKLCGVIGWSWWLVLLPVYGPPLLLTALVLAAYVVVRALMQ